MLLHFLRKWQTFMENYAKHFDWFVVFKTFCGFQDYHNTKYVSHLDNIIK